MTQREELEKALTHINAALNEYSDSEIRNEWVIRKARQALRLELWDGEK